MDRLVGPGEQSGRMAGFLQSLAVSDQWVGRSRLVLALAARNPAEASGFFDQALKASRFSDRYGRSTTRAEVAKAMAVADPERALAVAKDIGDKFLRCTTIRDLARIATGFDRDQAVRLLAEAERVARRIREKSERAGGLYGVAEALAPLDPAWAERVAGAVDHPGLGPGARSAVALLVARADPARAERMGRALAYGADTASVLAISARYCADPDRTAALLAEADERVRTLEPDARKIAAMTQAARTVFVFDPGRAAARLDVIEAMTGRLVDTAHLHLLLKSVRTTAEMDPDRAARILKTVCAMTLSPDSQVINNVGRGLSLLSIAKQCMEIVLA